ncbi:hypothetical protein PHMEG_0003495 [Phytophthora megakarya]|uniref:Reverse transcriptase n=1 Tax=Phytophthora megakarya TaxID=4795 RepID=A0A225WYK2_9STRA|nr:hypothetical protein PHMEG_0003495 [Phytophthora megakarya]
MSAGMRLCVHEGAVKLPDEESLLLVDGPGFENLGMDLTWLRPGEHLVVPIQYGPPNPEFLECWTGHGETLVTRFIYGVNRRPKAVKAVNISSSIATVYRNTVVAHVMEKRYLSSEERFVRPSSRKYGEWGTLIYEAEPLLVLPEYEGGEKLWENFESVPSVKRPVYPWPKKMLMRRIALSSCEVGYLPELKDLNPIVDLGTANIGEPEKTTQGKDARVQGILEKHHKILLGDGNAVPTPARGVVCGLDVNYYMKLELRESETNLRLRKVSRICRSQPPSKVYNHFSEAFYYYNKFIEDLSVVAAVLYELVDGQI